jgi:hypothetical protein
MGQRKGTNFFIICLLTFTKWDKQATSASIVPTYRKRKPRTNTTKYGKNGNKKSKKTAENTHVQSGKTAENATVQPTFDLPVQPTNDLPVQPTNDFTVQAANNAESSPVHAQNVATARANILARKVD